MLTSPSSSLSEPIENLLNLGPTSAAWLREADISTIADLEQLGPVRAWQRVKQRQPRASLNLLWALVAGLQNRSWQSLSDEEKAQWRAKLNERP